MFQQALQAVKLCRLLVAEINSNHISKTTDGLARNVHLIRELDSNVSKVCMLCSAATTSQLMTSLADLVQVVALYKEMSSNMDGITAQPPALQT